MASSVAATRTQQRKKLKEIFLFGRKRFEIQRQYGVDTILYFPQNDFN
jgi:hypothetical protein